MLRRNRLLKHIIEETRNYGWKGQKDKQEKRATE
jgi:hypothetical protein